MFADTAKSYAFLPDFLRLLSTLKVLVGNIMDNDSHYSQGRACIQFLRSYLITDQQMTTVMAVTAAMITTTRITTPTAVPTSTKHVRRVTDDDCPSMQVIQKINNY
jgi:hypothetical protein